MLFLQTQASVAQRRIRVPLGFMAMIAESIVRIHFLGINAKGNANVDQTCVIILMDAHL